MLNKSPDLEKKIAFPLKSTEDSQSHMNLHILLMCQGNFQIDLVPCVIGYHIIKGIGEARII